MATMISCTNCGAFIEQNTNSETTCHQCGGRLCPYHGYIQGKECEQCRKETELQMQHWMHQIDQDLEYVNQECRSDMVVMMNVLSVLE